MKDFKGKVLFLDKSDINTDEIIPAKYLTEITKEALKSYLLEDLKLDGFDSKNDLNDKNIVVSRSNFGCGSSREHAPWAFEVNDINVVIAVNFARIFRQNMFNCGMLAIELSEKQINYLFDNYANKDTFFTVDLKNKKIEIQADNQTESIDFSVSQFDEALVNAGGWLDFADKNY